MAAAVMALSVAVLSLVSHTSASAQQMAIPGQFGVSGSGSATYGIPISVPPGTAGMTPALALGFSSQGGNGIVGMGWSLSGLPSISRCPRTFALDGVFGGVNFDSNDRFCLDGQRLMAINNGTYGADGTEYRTEIESFTRVISHGTAGNGPAWFEVHTKSGQIMQFGNTADSQVLAQGKPTARNWAVNKVSDTKGNYFTVTYTNDTANGQAYPIEIDYTGNATTGLAPYNSVKFVYATRPDITPTYQAGSLSKTTVRLTDVQTYTDSSLVADYRLAYDTTITSISSLTSVTLCAADGSCLRPTAFTSTSGSGGTFSLSWQPFPSSTTLGWPPTANWTPVVGDFNGDGKTDFAFVGGTGVDVWLSNGDGTFLLSWQAFPSSTTLGWPPTTNWAPMVGDFNGDGKTDFAFAGGTGVNVWLSNGDGTFSLSWFPYGDLSTPNFGWPPTTSWTPVVGDFNGDGKTDFAFVGGTGVNVWLGNGDGTFSLSWQPFPSSTTLGWPPTANWTPIVGDFNGDGKTDFAFAGGTGVDVWLSNGDGTFSLSWQPFPSSTTLGWPPTANWTPVIGDFNGDGKTDFAFAGGTGVDVWLSNGDGTFSLSWQAFPSSTTLGWPPTANWAPLVADFNGDGKMDFAFLGGTGVDVWLSNGDGTFLLSWQPFPSSTTFGWPPTANWTPVVGDFNGDGKTDFAVVGGTGVDVFLSSAPPFYQVNAVTNGLGATTSITYQPLTSAGVYTKDTTSTYPMVDLQAPLYVVSRVDTTNGIGGTSSTAYTYAGAKADLSGRGFLGFRQMTATNLQNNIVATTNSRQDYPYIGMTASTTKTLGALTLNTTKNAYGDTWVDNSHFQVFLTQSQSSGADLDGSPLPTVTTSYQYDALGNATQVAVSATDGHSKTTTNTYTNDTTNWLLGRLTNASVTSQLSQPGPAPALIPTSTLVTISANTKNFNLWNYLVANNLATAGAPANVWVSIDGGVIIGSTSPSLPAFDTGVFPAGSWLGIGNWGIIVGAGGNGGAGGSCSAPAASGGPGGPALRTQTPLTLQNNTSIWGGGGGGGGGSGGQLMRSGVGFGLYPGGGGGGGGGVVSGSGGAGASTSAGTSSAGSSGSMSAGGVGGAGSSVPDGHTGSGAAGGAPGQGGSAGSTAGGSVGGISVSNCQSPGAGGASGPAVIGNSFITWTTTGDVRGPLN